MIEKQFHTFVLFFQNRLISITKCSCAIFLLMKLYTYLKVDAISRLKVT